MTKFIAYNDLAIFGIGDTEEDAISMVIAECGPFHDDEGVELSADETDEIRAAVERDFKTGECTAALAKQIEEEGGTIAWDFVDGIACTVAEADEAI